MITFLVTAAVVLVVVFSAWLDKRDVNLLSVAITLFVLFVLASAVVG